MSGFDLVTGGAGFIGVHLVRVLRDSGRRVRVLDIADRPDGLPADEYVRGSVLDADACRRAAGGVERVFHVAGDASLWRRRPQGYRELNVGGTEAMLAAAVACGVRRFVHTSTDVVAFPRLYGAYARSKHEAERAVRSAVAQGLDAVIVRPAAPIGPGDTNLTPPTQMLRFFLTSPPPAYYNGEVAWIDARDLAAAIAATADGAETGSIVTAGGEPEPMARMVEAIGAVAARRMPRATIPYPLALAAALVAEATVGRITGRAPIASSAGVRIAKRGRPRERTISAAQFGVPCRPIAESVADAARWLVAEGHVPRECVRPGVAQQAAAGSA
jgi:dihydroflavonol-4-reductase